MVLVLVASAIIIPSKKYIDKRFTGKNNGNTTEKPNKDSEKEEENNNGDEDIIEEIDLLEGTTYEDDEGNLILVNVNDILVLVNKKRNLPSDYIPEDLVVPNVRFSFNEIVDKRHLRKEAANALEELFAGGEEEGIILFGVSGYRSYERQKVLFNNKKSQVGEEKARQVVAYPGQSEHQTGLTIDVSSQSAGFGLVEDFGKTKEGVWLKENAHRFGFIIRYEEDTTEITGYTFEPWHIRYVGKEAAGQIFERKITLEEYLGDI